MAKSKARAKATAKKAKPKAKGQPKRSANARKGASERMSKRTAAERSPLRRKAKAQVPGEKAVADTSASFPVQPERTPPGEREAMPLEALDRRRQVIGTDDPGDVEAP